MVNTDPNRGRPLLLEGSGGDDSCEILHTLNWTNASWIVSSQTILYGELANRLASNVERLAYSGCNKPPAPASICPSKRCTLLEKPRKNASM